jgi:hypothetical protein
VRILALLLLGASLATAGKPDAEAVARHYEALLKTAESNANLGKGALRGGALFDLYVQSVLTEAAKAGDDAKKLDAELRAAFVALGLFVDDSALKSPLLAKTFGGLETEAQEKQALKVRGTPTAAGRADAAKHFLVSAAIAAANGEGAARMAGVAKEMEDMHALDHGAGTGYSFADLAANEAGIVFVGWLLQDPADRLKKAEAKFSQASCVPSLEGLVEGLRTDEFDDKYGPVGSEAYNRFWKPIEEKIAALPLYQEAEKK